MKSSITDKLVKDHLKEIEEHITALEQLVNPNTPVITNEDRHLYGRGGGNANKLLVADVSQLAKTQPQLNSPLIDWSEFASDNLAGSTIGGWVSRINAVAYKLESAKMMHEFDNYNDAIDQYAHLQYLTRNNVQGASEAYNQLRGHFRKGKASKDKPDK
ncbi:hypothetical protein [Acetobacteroides hydrogenigenes]|uniref:Uncharacterized protein n=1 Tax=Acetobacteroides hydrogenigenes TaxID=979970 RepID=A0A4R2EUA6_9BACT|nr:hypothetical protein [Acetobacteroides hydrogenigenes]TCN72879.1 hypothetical protein CLV25_10197 [Acetobacteroides hydrogenigenes]